MQMCQPSDLSWYRTRERFSVIIYAPAHLDTAVPCKATRNARICVGFVHVLESCCRRSLSKIDELVGAARAADEHETTSSHSTVIHTSHANAKDGSNQLLPSQCLIEWRWLRPHAASAALPPSLNKSIPI
jgi:hypothetical protein